MAGGGGRGRGRGGPRGRSGHLALCGAAAGLIGSGKPQPWVPFCCPCRAEPLTPSHGGRSSPPAAERPRSVHALSSTVSALPSMMGMETGQLPTPSAQPIDRSCCTGDRPRRVCCAVCCGVVARCADPADRLDRRLGVAQLDRDRGRDRYRLSTCPSRDDRGLFSRRRGDHHGRSSCRKTPARPGETLSAHLALANRGRSGFDRHLRLHTVFLRHRQQRAVRPLGRRAVAGASRTQRHRRGASWSAMRVGYMRPPHHRDRQAGTADERRLRRGPTASDQPRVELEIRWTVLPTNRLAA